MGVTSVSGRCVVQGLVAWCLQATRQAKMTAATASGAGRERQSRTVAL